MAAPMGSNNPNKAYIQAELNQLNEMRLLVQGALKSLDSKQLDEVNAKIKQAMTSLPLGHNVLKNELGKLQLTVVQIKACLDEPNPKTKSDSITEIAKDLLTATSQEQLIGELQGEAKSAGTKEGAAKAEGNTKTALASAAAVKTKPRLSPGLKDLAVQAYKKALADPSHTGLWSATRQLAQFYLIENRVPEIKYDFTAHNTLHPIIDSWERGGAKCDITINRAENSREEMVIDYEEVGSVPRSKVEEWAQKMLPDKVNPSPTAVYEDFEELNELPADILKVKNGFGPEAFKGRFLVHDSDGEGQKTLSYCSKENGSFKQEDLIYDPNEGQFLVKLRGENEVFRTGCSTIGEYIASHGSLNPQSGLTRKEIRS